MQRSDMQRAYPEKPAQVYFFGTCLIDLFYPEAGMAGIQLLEREGVKVIYPQQQSCCGQPAYNSGYDNEARKVAAAQIACLQGGLPVVVPSASCADMFRHHYPDLFADTPLRKQALDLAARTYELTEFLAHVCKVRLVDHGPAATVAIHNSCSAQRGMKTAQDAISLLRQMRNVAIVQQERASECCGFGGTFAVKAPDISNAMVQDKCDNLLATGASDLVSGDCGCLMNISGALEKRKETLPAQHIASFIWERTQ
ncbi:Fe-S oxidoreductase [Hahella chejuensis KCTC 2396]|uniref:Fe-S oxidoreductase n=2 Tax=Hahella chejuensis TaxID=158327 RepID=Q2SMI6_HAHCH|nr:Fe-S oxidoreductase [Hahella chejuensis KCTC 2396]